MCKRRPFPQASAAARAANFDLAESLGKDKPIESQLARDDQSRRQFYREFKKVGVMPSSHFAAAIA